MGTLTVACCNVGNYLNRGEEYVSKLRSMCSRYLPPHAFMCLTETEHAGWWCKLDLFKPGRFTGDTLYFDLDLVIAGDLTDLPNLLNEHDFWALDDFAWPLSESEGIKAHFDPAPEDLKLDVLTQMGGWGTCNSSVMLWRDEAGREIWERYSPEAAAGLHGDQNWITKIMGDRLHLIPRGWARSYRLNPPGAPITVYHGEGKPHEVHDPDWY